MCPYCDKEYADPMIASRSENEATDVYVDYTRGVPTLAMEVVLFGSSTFHSCLVRYCPMCGRDLRGGSR